MGAITDEPDDGDVAALSCCSRALFWVGSFFGVVQGGPDGDDQRLCQEDGRETVGKGIDSSYWIEPYISTLFQDPFSCAASL